MEVLIATIVGTASIVLFLLVLLKWPDVVISLIMLFVLVIMGFTLGTMVFDLLKITDVWPRL